MKNVKRKDEQGEVFTPPPLVNELLDQLPQEKFDSDTATFLDNSCGNGNFLVAIYERLIQYGHSKDNALDRIYGVDLMLDNAVETIVRLYNIRYSEGDWTDSSFQLECCTVQWFSYSDKAWKFYEPNQLGATTAMFRYKGYTIKNIVCSDALRYHYRFDGTHPYDEGKYINTYNELFD